MCVCLRMCSSSSSTGLFPSDFTTKAWSPLLDGDPPAWYVYHIPILQSFTHHPPLLFTHTYHTHTHTHIHTTTDTCHPLGSQQCCQEIRGTNYSSLLFLSLPRQPHKTALQPLRPPPPQQVQVLMPTHAPGLGVEVCAVHWTIRSGPLQW